MRRIVTALAICAVLSFAGCSTVDRNAVNQIEVTHAQILPKYLEYVSKDATLSDPQKEDRKKLVESLQRIVAALKKSAGGE